MKLQADKQHSFWTKGTEIEFPVFFVCLFLATALNGSQNAYVQTFSIHEVIFPSNSRTNLKHFEQICLITLHTFE